MVFTLSRVGPNLVTTAPQEKHFNMMWNAFDVTNPLPDNSITPPPVRHLDALTSELDNRMRMRTPNLECLETDEVRLGFSARQLDYMRVLVKWVPSMGTGIRIKRYAGDLVVHRAPWTYVQTAFGGLANGTTLQIQIGDPQGVVEIHSKARRALPAAGLACRAVNAAVIRSAAAVDGTADAGGAKCRGVVKCNVAPAYDTVFMAMTAALSGASQRDRSSFLLLLIAD